MAALSQLIAFLATVNQKLAVVCRHGAWILLVLMTFIVVAQVFFRYVLNSSLGWSEDVSLMMMIWVAFLVAPIAYRGGANVALDTFSRFLPGRLFYALYLLIHLLLLLMLALLIVEAVALVGRSTIRANTVPIQMKYIYMVMPAAFAAMVLVGLELNLRCLLGLANPDAAEARLPSEADTDASEAERLD